MGREFHIRIYTMISLIIASTKFSIKFLILEPFTPMLIFCAAVNTQVEPPLVMLILGQLTP